MTARTSLQNNTFPESGQLVNGPSRAHRLRNSHVHKAHNTIQGDFWLFADDDNTYLPGFAQTVKDVVSGDLTSPYFFRGHIIEKNELIWREPEIYLSNIDTGCGVIPSSLLSSGTWGSEFGGDFIYFDEIIKSVSRYYMIDVVIFNYNKYANGPR